jgi:hypothetical protein
MGINAGSEPIENAAHNNQSTIQVLTTVQANERWGDDISRKKDGTTRLYFQNVNSMGLPKPDKWRNILNCLTIKNCDIVGLAETCADCKNKSVSQLVRTEARAVAKHAALAFSENRTISESTYLPGGTRPMATGRWCGRYQRTLNDEGHKGRWFGQQFNLQANKSLFCVTAYRPCIQG